MSKSIIIDPGHGGTDPGANGFGVREKDWTLKMSLYQYKRLKELGAKVAITRTKDTTLSSTKRTNIIRGNYDYCISNHWNAFNGSARGIETIHSIFGGKAFAQDIANALVKETGLPLRRVFSRKNNRGTDYYFMHRLTGSTRTVIVEYSFIDNRADHNWYKNTNNFYKAAEAVIEVLCKQLGIAYKSPNGNSATKSSGSTQFTGAKLVKKEDAYFLATENIKVRTAPNTNATYTGTLPKGASINYKSVYEGNGYRWLQYIGNSGSKLYLPYRSTGKDKTEWGTFHDKRPGDSKPAKLYKVQTGAFADKKNAQKQLDEVIEHFGSGLIVEVDND